MWIQFHPFDRALLERQMFTDIGAIAHRTDVPEAHFEEGLVVAEDWDLLLRLTEGRPPLELPVIACRYRTDATDRLSDDISEADLDAVRSRTGRAGS